MYTLRRSECAETKVAPSSSHTAPDGHRVQPRKAAGSAPPPPASTRQPCARSLGERRVAWSFFFLEKHHGKLIPALISSKHLCLFMFLGRFFSAAEVFWFFCMFYLIADRVHAGARSFLHITGGAIPFKIKAMWHESCLNVRR